MVPHKSRIGIWASVISFREGMINFGRYHLLNSCTPLCPFQAKVSSRLRQFSRHFYIDSTPLFDRTYNQHKDVTTFEGTALEADPDEWDKHMFSDFWPTHTTDQVRSLQRYATLCWYSIPHHLGWNNIRGAVIWTKKCLNMFDEGAIISINYACQVGMAQNSCPTMVR